MNPNQTPKETDDIQELLDSTDRMLEMVREDREQQAAAEAAGADTTDFNTTFETNVSKTKRIPTERLVEGWNAKLEAAHREAEQGHTSLPGALQKRFGKQIPIIEDGRVIGLEDPNAPPEQVKEVRKGTPSRQIHGSRTSKSKVTWRPKGSNQRDMADNDAKVKTERELRGDI